MADPNPLKKGDNRLPLAKIERIMKCSDGCNAYDVSAEAVFLVRKATELFIAELAQRAMNNNNNKILDYKQLADVVQDDEKLDFIHEMIPRKITVKQYKGMVAQREARKMQFSDSDDYSSEEETENVKTDKDVIK